MSNRKQKKETYIDGKRVVGVSEAARILTQRARAMGSNRTYSRDAVYQWYSRGILKAAAEASSGNLYFVEDIEALPIDPARGKRSGTKGGASREPSMDNKESARYSSR